MDHEQFFLYCHLHPGPRGLPPPDHLLPQVQEAPGRPQSRLRPLICQPNLSPTPIVLPLPLCFQGSRLLQAPHEGPHLRLPPLDWRTETPSPPIRKHLSIDALAHLTLPLQEGLSRLPLVLQAPPPPEQSYLSPSAHEANLPDPSWPC